MSSVSHGMRPSVELTIHTFDPAFGIGKLLFEIVHLLLTLSFALTEQQQLVDTLYSYMEQEGGGVTIGNTMEKKKLALSPLSRHSLRLACGSCGNRRWRSFSNRCFSVSRNVLAYLRFLSRTSRTLPSESRSSSPSSVNDSDAGPERAIPRCCGLPCTGSYRELPRVESVGERRTTPLLLLPFSPLAVVAVGVTGLEPTECHMSGEELNDGACMGAEHWVPCAMWVEAVAGAAPALALTPAPKCRAFSCCCRSGGVRDGEAGKEDLYMGNMSTGNNDGGG